MTAVAVEARDVVLSFGETPALRGASVAAVPGEILAVMGPSGSGKSTLLHCLAGILVPASGEVYFGGRRLDTLGETERSRLRRDRFGFVFQLPMLSVVVVTDGSAAAIERARTALEDAFPQGRFPATVGEFEANFARTLVQFQQLANVVILATLPIAGCSLAVSVAGGLSDRKRPFSLLRLTGVELSVLRRVVALESAVPLLVVAVLAIGTGLLAAHLFLTSQMDYALRPPPPAYFLSVAAGIAVSFGIIASTMPLLRRITGPETARNE